MTFSLNFLSDRIVARLDELGLFITAEGLKKLSVEVYECQSEDRTLRDIDDYLANVQSGLKGDPSQPSDPFYQIGRKPVEHTNG